MSTTAFRSNGREREPLYYNFSTNAAPVNGTCQVDPPIGYADTIKTLFNVSCADYQDEDLPLNYTLFVDFTGQLSLHRSVITSQVSDHFTISH